MNTSESYCLLIPFVKGTKSFNNYHIRNDNTQYLREYMCIIYNV